MGTPEFKSQRKELRHGVVAALTNLGAAPFPTRAENRVFDSRQAPYVVHDGDPLPAIAVYTDTTKRNPMTTEGHPPFETVQEIVIELSIGGSSGRIETDHELECALDDFEEEVLAALFDISNREGARAFRQMYKRLTAVESMRLGNNTDATRLAMRDILLVVEFDQRQCGSLDRAFPLLKTLKMCFSEKGVVFARTEDTIC